MRKVRENILASHGNLLVFTEGSQVFSPPTVQGESHTINVAPNQWVIYDAESPNPVGLGPGVTASDVNKLTIAVAVDINGDGAADELRKPFGDWISPWGIRKASAQCPSCGIPAIEDVQFRCLQNEESYGITVQVFNDMTDNQYPYNVPAIYDYTVKVADLDCDNCSQAEVSEKVVCALVEKINGNPNRSSKTIMGLRNPNGDKRKIFQASRLFANSYDFCLSSQNTGCEDCNHVQGVKGISIDSVVTNFTHTLDAANPTLSLTAQGERIVNQINAALGVEGRATLVKPMGKCCDLRIQINTCLTITGLVDSADALIAACGTSSPLAAVTLDVDCPTCPESAAPTAVFQGIRFYIDSPAVPCDCYPPNPPIGWMSPGEIRITGGVGFNGTNFRTRTIQKSTFAENLGYEWQYREFVQQVGGAGRDFEPYVDHFGPIGLPIKSERTGQVTVKCPLSYCSYILEHEIPFEGVGASDPKRYARGRSIFLIPSSDTVTTASFEAIINPFLLSTTCPNKAALSCSCNEEDPQVV